MYRPVLVTPPSAAPVTLDEVKAHLREDSTDQDALIGGLIAAAVMHLDGWTGILGRCLMPQTWRQDYNCFERCLRLPLFPVTSISSVKYEDEAGTVQTISASNYALQNDDLGAFIRFKSTYTFAGVSAERPAVHAEYVAGYADADDVPAPLKAAMLLMIGHWYANREAVSIGSGIQTQVVPMAADMLIAPYRRIRF